jgi:hypothetical protein
MQETINPMMDVIRRHNVEPYESEQSIDDFIGLMSQESIDQIFMKIKEDKVKKCNEIEAYVNQWIADNKERIKRANVDAATFECISVDYCLEQDLSERYLICCQEGDDTSLACEIIMAVKDKFNVNCICYIEQ